MSKLDTRKAGSHETISFATVRLESSSLSADELVDWLTMAAGRNADVDVEVEHRGTHLPNALTSF